MHAQYEPRRIVVLGLTLDLTGDDVLEFFEQFGAVTDVIVKVKPSNVYAFVEFEREDVMHDVLRRQRHMIYVPGGCLVVRVLRAYKSRLLPSRPFPGMDARTSPLRLAMQQQRQQWKPEHVVVWDQDLYRAIQSIWA